MPKNKITRILLSLIGILLLAVVVYNIPFVNQRLSGRLDTLRTRIVYFFRPPDEAVFVPAADSNNTATLPPPQVRTPTRIPATATPAPTKAGPTPTPTLTTTPLPKVVTLPGVKYVDQHNRWNYCGPANLAMALKFWGWTGQPGQTKDVRDQIAEIIKPGENDPKKTFIDRGKTDKNVMLYEMENFVNDETEFRALSRYGGDMELLKRLLAAGFPIMIEKGYYERDYTGKVSWLGHYLFVTGYDEGQKGFIVQDAYLKPGKNLVSKYETFQEGWRSFNYLFMVVYPANREQEVIQLLGDWYDLDWSRRHALEIAEAETKTLTGMDGFFAWFNKGTSAVEIAKGLMGSSASEADNFFRQGAQAYDKAFQEYSKLGTDDKQRPYRIMWYQTGPYWAYFYTGRYQDVVNLADTTFATIDKPTLEESLYWRGQAYYALGNSTLAIKDMREAVRLNYLFAAANQKLSEWGVAP